MSNPILNKEETDELAAFLTRKVKEFDPGKGTLGVFMRLCLDWQLNKISKAQETASIPEYNVKNVDELMVSVTKGDPLYSPDIKDVLVREEVNGLDGVTITSGRYKEGDGELEDYAPDVRISMNGETFYVRYKNPEDADWSEFREFYDYESIVTYIYEL